MYCHCCGAPATSSKVGRVLRFHFCDECAGARFVPCGTVSGGWGWDGKTVTERTFVLECPAHGRRQPVDVDAVDWLKPWPVVSRAGRRLMVLDYVEVR